MADWVDEEESILDCSTISISYQANGLASVSFTIYHPDSDDPPYSDSGPGFSLCAGGVRFKGWVTSQSYNAASDLDYREWRVSAVAVGCRDTDCSSIC